MSLKELAQKCIHWFTLDRVLALVGIAAGLVAIYYERTLHTRFVLQEKAVSGIVSSVTTRYVARFPANLEYATNLVIDAKPGDELLILNDVFGYGSYSCPPKFKEYLKQIKHAAERGANVRILIYGDASAKEVLRTQITPDDYREWTTNSDRFKSTTESVCEAVDLESRQKRFWYYFHAYTLPTPDGYENFLNTLEQTQNQFCRQVTSAEHFEVRATDERTGKGTPISQPIFFWMLKSKEVVFAYPNTGQIGKGSSFKSSDERLMQIFVDQFDDVWKKAHKLDSDCYVTTPSPALTSSK